MWSQCILNPNSVNYRGCPNPNNAGHNITGHGNPGRGNGGRNNWTRQNAGYPQNANGNSNGSFFQNQNKNNRQIVTYVPGDTGSRQGSHSNDAWDRANGQQQHSTPSPNRYYQYMPADAPRGASMLSQAPVQAEL